MTRERWDTYSAEGQRTGRTVLRGDPLAAGEYKWVVQIWIRNSAGQYLIQKRSNQLKHHPGIWAATAGHVLAGETPREGAIRELHEELGLVADPTEVRPITRSIMGRSISEAWLLERDVEIDSIVIQLEEVSDVMWATRSAIEKMIRSGRFFDYGTGYMGAVFQAQTLC